LHALHAIFLHQPGRDFRQGLVAEEGEKIDPELLFLALHILRIALAECHHRILDEKSLSSAAESGAGRKLAGAGFAPEFKIPVLRYVFRVREAFFLRGHAAVLAAEVSRDLPEATVLALIDVKLSAHQFVVFGHGDFLRETGQKRGFV
jgi:hypothetical protein